MPRELGPADEIPAGPDVVFAPAAVTETAGADTEAAFLEEVKAPSAEAAGAAAASFAIKQWAERPTSSPQFEPDGVITVYFEPVIHCMSNASHYFQLFRRCKYGVIRAALH